MFFEVPKIPNAHGKQISHTKKNAPSIVLFMSFFVAMLYVSDGIIAVATVPKNNMGKFTSGATIPVAIPKSDVASNEFIPL